MRHWPALTATTRPVSRRLQFGGEIAGLGTTSGVRVVVGRWTTSPYGTFADVMLQQADGWRVLLAPTQEIAEFIASTYVFDEVVVGRTAAQSERVGRVRRGAWSGTRLRGRPQDGAGSAAAAGSATDRDRTDLVAADRAGQRVAGAGGAHLRVGRCGSLGGVRSHRPARDHRRGRHLAWATAR